MTDPTVPKAVTRRLARITVDVLLPTDYFDVDLSELEVRSVAFKDHAMLLHDVITSSVVPATLMTLAES